jgi:hypothetical protein
MIKTLSAAMLAASILAAPALAMNTKPIHSHRLVTPARLMVPAVKAKPAVAQVHYRVHEHHHHQHHHHMHEHRHHG